MIKLIDQLTSTQTYIIYFDYTHIKRNKNYVVIQVKAHKYKTIIGYICESNTYGQIRLKINVMCLKMLFASHILILLEFDII